MNNEDVVQQLIYRRNRIDEMIPVQELADAKGLLSMERAYVDELIAFRQKHGNYTPIQPK